MMSKRSGVACVAMALMSVTSTQAAVRLTEFMSEGQGLTGQGSGAARQREFFEVTNLGNAPIDLTQWTYNDNNPNDPIAFGTAVGLLAAGESIVLTQAPVADFISYWQLPATVRVFTYLQLSNLGNADTINLYNSATQDATTLVDTLTYIDTERGSGVSRNRPFDSGQGQFDNANWMISASGDAFGSRFAPNPPGAAFIDLANPGVYVPEPASAGLLAVGGLTLLRRRRSR